MGMPVSPSVPGSVVVSCGESQGSIDGLQAGSAFTALPLEGSAASGTGDAVYEIAQGTGSYGASWDSSGSSWAVSTVAFK
jgi:hypothetical protein